ncbi:HAD family hydrolase [Pseudoduganella sp. UC29_71]|uniref:HAD family hydrolase n=1 Tax=Pseudoduganella sp. UC29_71 TaxID=3350174 RepID=UPI003672193C
MTLLALDLDGTLLDCEARQVALTRALLAQRGQPALDAAAFWRRKRAGASTRTALAAQYGDAPWLPELAQAWLAAVEQPQWLAGDQLLPGVAGVLEGLIAGGVALRLLTARGNHDGLHATLARLALAPYFEQVGVVDPLSASTQKAAILADWRPAAFIGDTESDLAAARQAGIPFAAVSWGQRDAAWLAAHGAASCHADLAAAISHLNPYLTSPTGAQL